MRHVIRGIIKDVNRKGWGRTVFFIFGINEGCKQLPFRQNIPCPVCGRYSAMTAWMTYTYFMLFFIPFFTWNRRYYVRMECCGANCEISPELGRDIENGKVTVLDPSKLRFNNSSQGSRICRCPNCGFETAEDFSFYPKCGRPLN